MTLQRPDSKLETAIQPEISVIIPTFNRCEMVQRAIDSVLAQKKVSFECLVIDDGSTDGTFDLLKEKYADELMENGGRLLLLSQDNRGVSAARNSAIAQSRGQYISLLDSDDEWESTMLSELLGYMQQHKYEICQTGELWMRNGKRVNPGKRHRKQEGFFYEKSLELCLISPSAVMFTRALWDRLGPFDESMAACEDYDLWLRVCLCYPVGLLNKPLMIRHGGRDDQLSMSVDCQDYFRIKAMVKILSGELPPRANIPQLTREQRSVTLDILRLKSSIYLNGLEKRGKVQEGEALWNLICNVVDRTLDEVRQIVADRKNRPAK
ncbi:MAG: glycosyltransferase family 2 protein [Desulfovibrio sp.]